MLVIAGVIHAQGIVHVVPNPQPYYTTGAPDTLDANIDIVGDGTTDFILESGHSFVSYATLTPQNDNQAVVQNGFVAAMNRGDTIGVSLASTNQWANGRLTIALLATLLGEIPGGNGEDGNFAHKPSGYIGFDMVDNGTNYYGWMLASCPSLGGLTGDAGIFAYITDWAFETSPNMPIMAGQIAEPISFSANLCGANEVPPNRSGHLGTGTFLLESFVDGFVLDFHLELDGAFVPNSAGIFVPANRAGRPPNLIAVLGIAQIVFSPPITNIGLVPFAPASLNEPITILPPPSKIVYDGQINLSSNQAVQLSRGQLYVNVKSARFPQGGLRGQIWPDTPIQFIATLTGRGEPPRRQVTHSGEAAFTLTGANLDGNVALNTNFSWNAMGIFALQNDRREMLAVQLTNVIGVMIPPGGLPDEPGLPGQVLYPESAMLTDRQVVQLKSRQLFLELLSLRNRNCPISGRLIQE